MLASSPEPIALKPFSMAVRQAGSQVGWFSDLMGTVVS
jgi:hypothetical protein